MAWRKGIMHFNDADVFAVMRQIQRWYDVEVVYDGEIPKRRFAGKIPGNSSIENVLHILSLSNIRCRIDGRKITVLPDESS
jgi:transmembrane sensor